jgi:hypothetical protein
VEIEHAVAVAPLSMMRVVPEDVPEAVVHLARRSKVVTVVAIGPDAPSATKQLVETSSKGDLEAANARTDGGVASLLRVRAVGLDDEMNVVRLDGEVDDAELALVAALPLVAQHTGDQLVDHLLPERRQAVPRPDRDMDGVSVGVLWPLPMPHARWPDHLATGAFSAASPSTHLR